MGIVAKAETFFKEFAQEEEARQRGQYQVVDVAAWMLKNKHVRALPGMTADHLGLLAAIEMYGVINRDQVPLRVTRSRMHGGLSFREDGKLRHLGIELDGVYEYSLTHPGAIVFKQIDKSPVLLVSVMFASSKKHMEQQVRYMQRIWSDKSPRISYDILTSTITAVSERRKIVSYYIPDLFAPLIPAGHEPIEVWAGAQV